MIEPINEYYFENGCMVQGVRPGKKLIVCFLRHRNIVNSEKMFGELEKISYEYFISTQYVFVDTLQYGLVTKKLKAEPPSLMFFNRNGKMIRLDKWINTKNLMFSDDGCKIVGVYEDERLKEVISELQAKVCRAA